MKVVEIDAGHGGKDPGAVGNDLKEKDITLKISTEIARRLNGEYEGVRCLLTRSTDLHLELEERTDMANKAKADLLLSIHVNAGGGAGGFESFTYNGNYDPKTAAYQNVLHTEIMAQLKKFSVIDRGQKKKNLHMVRESNMPSVLTECLFIDVAADASRLKQADVIEAFIIGHLNGIVKFLGLERKENDSLELTKNQRDMLVVTLQDLVKRGVISDKTWIEKAEKGTLTVSELTWLNTIIFSRVAK